jgi:zinc transport system permease protein
MELLTFTFVQHAFIGGILMAILAGVLGPFVVQSRQAIASDMFAHVALAGIGVALVAGISPWWGALPTLLLVSTLIWWLLETDHYSPDALAVFFLSGGLALALALVHVARDTTFAFETYLFGSILTLSAADLFAMAAATIIILLTIWNFWYPLIGATQSPTYSVPFRNTPKQIRLLYFWILATVVWIGIKTIGGLLIGALLVIPVLIVRSHSQSFLQVTIRSMLVALFSIITGLLLALYIDLPPSSLIIGVLLMLFICNIVLLSKRERRWS